MGAPLWLFHPELLPGEQLSSNLPPRGTMGSRSLVDPHDFHLIFGCGCSPADAARRIQGWSDISGDISGKQATLPLAHSREVMSFLTNPGEGGVFFSAPPPPSFCIPLSPGAGHGGCDDGDLLFFGE